ncbi:MAG: T9SS type A sorting domain-containing protein, partial [Muribaculaceae bacterium]|nr:T9SS type A sorting domain-containing protein [Muribaculaceae bacterium]
LPIADFADVNDIGIYPVYLMAITIEPSGKNGTEYRIEIPGIEAVYNNAQSGIDDVLADDQVAVVNVSNGLVSVSSGVVDSIEIFNLAGQLISKAENVQSVAAPEKGCYIVNVIVGGEVKSQKIII